MSEPEYTGKNTDFYRASEQVADTINLAVALNRPILVEGEPGCGKTMLAYAIAAEKGLEITKISVRSTSRAQDLLYRVNALRRLQEAQSRPSTQVRYIYPYLQLGTLGQAIFQKRRCVVLIDEVDKADIDFPNDLLDVLDTFSFQIDELPSEEEAQCLQEKGFGRVIESAEGVQPIVVITSNREKRLPEPFLRRCLYVRLKFPETAEELIEIVKLNSKQNMGVVSIEDLNERLVQAAVNAFQTVRQLAEGNTQKLPSTSELIDWVKILHWKGESVESLEQDPYRPPYWSVLFKTLTDLDNYNALAANKSRRD